MKKDRYTRITSFALVTFLYAKNQQIAGIRPTGEGDQKEFAFIYTPYLEELIDLYTFGPKDDERLLVPVHKYEQSRRELLNALRHKRLHQDENEPIKY